MRAVLLVLAFATAANAFSAMSSFAPRAVASVTARRSARSGRSNLRMENFGLSFAEDQEENTPAEILGELRLKEGYVKGLTKEGQASLLVEDYPLLRRVGELNLLTITAESGLLGALEAKGLTLSKLEELLPVAERLGLLSFVASRPIIYNGLAFLLVEPAPLLIGPAVGVVEVGDKLFPVLAAVCAALEAKGLSEGEFSLPLVLGTALFGGLGLLLGGKLAVPEA